MAVIPSYQLWPCIYQLFGNFNLWRPLMGINGS
nr:MAG TPA: hypothetical protein [Caudoviricetes sp.]